MPDRGFETMQEMDARTKRRARLFQGVMSLLVGLAWALAAGWAFWGPGDVDWSSYVFAIGSVVFIPLGVVQWRRRHDDTTG